MTRRNNKNRRCVNKECWYVKRGWESEFNSWKWRGSFENVLQQSSSHWKPHVRVENRNPSHWRWTRKRRNANSRVARSKSPTWNWFSPAASSFARKISATSRLHEIRSMIKKIDKKKSLDMFVKGVTSLRCVFL